MLTIALATLKEAIRRRLVVALLILTLVVVGFSTWGYGALIRTDALQSLVTRRVLAVEEMVLFMFMFAGMVALTAIFASSATISNEAESGIALATLARPIRRSEYVIGKWLGLAFLIAIYAAGTTALEMLVIFKVAGYGAPDPVATILFVTGEGIVMMSLGLCLSTRFSGLTAGVISAATYFVSWLLGVVGSLGTAVNNPSLITAAAVGHLLLPSDAFWWGTVYSLEPKGLITLAEIVAPDRVTGNPMFFITGPPPALIAWGVVWIALALGIAVWSFSRRQL